MWQNPRNQIHLPLEKVRWAEPYTGQKTAEEWQNSKMLQKKNKNEKSKTNDKLHVDQQSLLLLHAKLNTYCKQFTHLLSAHCHMHQDVF